MPKSWTAPLILGLLLALVSIIPIAQQPIAFGWDFHLFYAAGQLPSSDLYNLDAQRAAEQTIWEQHRRGQVDQLNFSPFFRPAYYRLALVPLAALPYWTAYCLWVTLQAGALIAALVLLGRRFGFEDSYWVLILMTPYLWRSLAWGQDVFAVLFAIALSLELLGRGREKAAGAVLALALVKWNVLLLVPLVLLASGRKRLFASFAAVATAEVALSLAIMGRQGLTDFLASLHAPIADHTRLTMPSLRGLLLNLHVPDGVIVPVALALSLALVWFARKLPAEKAIATAVTGSVALGLHTMSYDILLFFIPLFVLRPTRLLPWPSVVLLPAFSPLAMLKLETSSGLFEMQGPAGVSLALLMLASAFYEGAEAAVATPYDGSNVDFRLQRTESLAQPHLHARGRPGRDEPGQRPSRVEG
jgi:hypothetical protein